MLQPCFQHLLFALLQRVEENTAFIEMVPEPYFDEEMGVTDTIWMPKTRIQTNPLPRMMR